MIEALAGLVILLGIVGTVIPILPGSLLVGVTVIAYGFYAQDRTTWVVTAVVLVILLLGWIAKWLIPARTVAGEVDRLPLIVGGVLAFIGFFVIPVVGLLVGFIVGVFGTELFRTRSWNQAWPATKRAITAAGLSMLIELASVVVAGSVWVTAMVFT